MKLLSAMLCAAAGLAGWGAVAWWEGTRGADGAYRPDTAHEAVAAIKAAGQTLALPPSAGSSGLSRLTDLLGAMPRGEAFDLAYAWPEGTARSLALSLLGARKLATDDPFADPLAAEDGEEPNRFRTLAEALIQGKAHLRDPHGAGPDDERLREWVHLDPGAATAAIRQMPPGEDRDFAVDAAAFEMAHDDPAAALDLVLQTGAAPGAGAAQAWAAMTMLTAEVVKNGYWYLKQLSAAQQDQLFMSVAEELGQGRVSDGREPIGGLGDAQSPLERVARSLLEAGEYGPGMEAFFHALTKYPEAAESIRAWAAMLEMVVHKPGIKRAREIITAEQAASLAGLPDSPVLLALAIGVDIPGIPLRDPAILVAAAPRMLPNLCRTGHVAEAVQVLNRLTDADAWRKSFEIVLPYWMDADPSAARAAFNAASLTALERERWQRHPAFLLHP